jgi:hypothetical protein
MNTIERELLIQAIDAYDHKEEPYFERLNHAFEEIRNYLICEPEDEPVAWIIECDDDERPILREIDYSHDVIDLLPAGTKLYLHPAAPERKPMTKEEIKNKGKFSDRALPWITAGVRLAEKHHGIGGEA